jgi:hypothetical protein
LNTLARGFGIQMLAKREFDFDTNLVMKQQLNDRGRETDTARKSKDNFLEGNTPEYKRARNTQQSNWTVVNTTLLRMVDGPTLNEVKRALDHVKDLSQQPSNPQVNNRHNHRMMLPIVESRSTRELFVDEYYDEIRHWLAFDDKACCQQVPDPDESVFVNS